MDNKEQAIIPMEEYKRLRGLEKNIDSIALYTRFSVFQSIGCAYVGRDETMKRLAKDLDTALGLIEKIESAGLLGRIFFKGFKKEYGR